LAEALVAAQAAGVVKAVGVSNYSAKETRKIDEALRKRGTRLASNQIEYSLLRTAPERGGLLATCRELGVVPLAYSPMGQGRLSGKYSAANPPAGKRSFSAHPWERIDAVVGVLRKIADAHDRTPGQVALAWCIAKGAVPIPGAKNGSQAEQNAGALGWAMSDDELAALDGVALEGVRSLQNRFWQHG
jgi:aryl-alcohol dehydrogenase-like predicted oxidoreductase